MSTLLVRKIKTDKVVAATAIALLFHISGLIGILLNESFFVNSTVLNLLLMFFLVIWTHTDKRVSFFLFVLIASGVGFLTEFIGISSGILFGEYSYKEVLGMQYKGVPFIIGVNWFIVMYCCGATSYYLVKLIGGLHETTRKWVLLKTIVFTIMASTMALGFDWIMEPVAMKLKFWTWKNDTVPLLNYQSWWVISFFILLIFNQLKFAKDNLFAVHLLLIQSIFFLLLRLFL
jgi:bisanhydrobacterioruberin hydratase